MMYATPMVVKVHFPFIGTSTKVTHEHVNYSVSKHELKEISYFFIFIPSLLYSSVPSGEEQNYCPTQSFRILGA